MTRYTAVFMIFCLLANASPVSAQDRVYVIDGVVKAIDEKKQEVTILRANGKETTVKFTDKTQVLLDAKASLFSKIKLKQEIRCCYWLDSKEATVFGMYVDLDRPPYVGER